MTEPQMQQMINEALLQGFYTFDLADIYGDYTLEASFGKAISSLEISRESYQLISKCGIKLPGPNNDLKIKSYDYSKSYIISQVEKSLEDLKTPYLDLLLLHRPSPLMNPEEVALAFQYLAREGMVRNFGVSNFKISELSLLSSVVTNLTVNQIEVSLTSPELLLDGTVDYLYQHGITVMAYGVLGNYFSRSKADNPMLIETVRMLAKKYETTQENILLAFIRKHPSGIIPLVGSTKRENLSVYKMGLSVCLSDEDWFLLLQMQRGVEVP